MPVIDIGPAVLEDVRPDLVIARSKVGSVAEAASFQLSMKARREHFSTMPHGVLVVAPDDVEFRAGLLDQVHYKDQQADAFTRALAVVSTSQAFIRIIEQMPDIGNIHHMVNLIALKLQKPLEQIRHQE